jgi:alpha-tubulin suppressor-like RCC1 family protein
MKLLLLSLSGSLLVTVLLVSGRTEPERAEAATYASVSSGAHSTCALAASPGAVRCWGWNKHGELGLGTVSAPYTLSKVAVPVCASGVWNGTTCNGGSGYTAYALSTGSSGVHTCGQVIYLIVQCWGNNHFGQVGNGTSGQENYVLNPTTVQCQGSSSYCVSNVLAGIGQVATGGDHSCGVDFGGYVWCWGWNTWGQLGDGTTTDRSYATRVCATGSGQDCTNGTLLSGVYAVAAGEAHTCAYLSSGGVKCWGNNGYGQLGDGTQNASSLPVGVSGLSSGVSAVTAGGGHTCALLTSGGAKCWGYNADAELGDGTLTNRTAPVSVCATGAWDGAACDLPGLPEDDGTALSGISSLSAGGAHTCALMTSSPYVKCWGLEYFGSLGNGLKDTFVNRTNPVAWTVPSWGSPQPSALAVGGLHTCALISGYAECWGWNDFGQLGNNSQTTAGTWIGSDMDKDGCIDAYELGPNHAYGGQRDPTNFYDFFDTPNDSGVRDKVVDAADAARVAARQQAVGTPTNDPLTPPPPAPTYHPAFDRQDDPNSSEAWDLIVGNGTILVTVDVPLLNAQSGDTCATPTPTLTPGP